MTVEVGGGGVLGVGIETTLGTYVPPTKWIPIRSESLQVTEDTIYRMNLRGTADRTGVIAGYTHVEGDIVFEVTPDVLTYFFYAARVTPTKAGASAPFTYTFTPAHVAKTSTAAGATNRKTLSILVHRSARPFGYLGCSVSQLAFSIDSGILICTATIYGTDEVAQSAGTPTYTAQVVAGPGKLTLEVPTATVRADTDTFTATINDNATQANRLDGTRKAAYVNWGEREITAHYEVDFDALTDYTAFRNKTIQAVTFKAIPTATAEEFTLLLNATAIDAAPINLAGLGDVNRASIDMHGFYNTTAAYLATIITAETIT